MAMASFVPAGLPLVTRGDPCRFVPPTMAVDGIVMADPGGTYANYHREFFIETTDRQGQVVERTPFRPEYPYLIFGRDPGCAHVFCGHDTVSGQQAAFFWAYGSESSDEMCYIQNLEPTHVTRVSNPGEIVVLGANETRLIRLDDIIEFGRAPVTYRFIREVAIAIPPAPPPVVQDIYAAPIPDAPPPSYVPEPEPRYDPRYLRAPPPGRGQQAHGGAAWDDRGAWRGSGSRDYL
jgi:hypothetical protein